MKLREIEKKDYDLILELDAKVYPVSKENKINPETIERWYNKYPKYGMIYSYQNKIVALSIAIPMPRDKNTMSVRSYLPITICLFCLKSLLIFICPLKLLLNLCYSYYLFRHMATSYNDKYFTH